MIYQEILRRVIAEDQKVLTQFTDVLAPKILEYFAAVPALGGSGRPPILPELEIPSDLQTFTGQDYANFSRLPDQSMATHLLNGIFSAMKLADKLPPQKSLKDDEKRLWIMGYICHDYTKIYGVKISAGNIPRIQDLIAKLGELLNFSVIQPDWKHYLGDITFLAQNTQTREGSNLDISRFDTRTDRRTLDTLRLLSSIADVLVHIKSPSEVVISPPEHQTAENLREKMISLFGANHAPRLAYHKITEVRGLLSNLINNVTIDIFHQQGCEPFLFFPNGVVYLTPPSVKPTIKSGELQNQIWYETTSIITANEEIGIKRGDKGLKVNPVIYELVDPPTLIRIGRQFVMSLRNSKSQKIIPKEQIKQDNLAIDLRTDQLAEFLVFLKRRVFKKLFPQAKGISEMLLETLGLQDQITVKEAEFQMGGFLFGWWYVAGRYLFEHPTIDDYQLEELMTTLQDSALNFIEIHQLKPNIKSSLADSFAHYLESILEVDGKTLSNNQIAFETEFNHYVDLKARNRPVCSLCSTPYESIQQSETAVLFKPQQYTNKMPLGSSKMPPRGICPICLIEMILRMVQQNAPGKSFQDKKPVYFWLYPTYFFTTETAQVVRSFTGQLRDLNFLDLRKHLHRKGFTISALIGYNGFTVNHQDDPVFRIIRQNYDDHDLAALFNFAIHPFGEKPSDTDSWIIPAFYAIAFPLLLDLKVVATTSFVPLFSSGADFKESAILDAPQQFIRYALGKDRFRVDELPEAIIRLLRLYDLHIDVFSESKDFHWPQINALAKDIFTDPNYVFFYFDRKRRKEKIQNDYISRDTVQHYLQTYHILGGDKEMGRIGQLVDAYAAFYRGKPDSAYSVLKPLAEAADIVINSDPNVEKDDLHLLVVGAISDLMERVWNNQADGWDPIVMVKSEQGYLERRESSREKQKVFTQFFLEEIFYDYCDGDRGLLRERLNRLRSAARFYYLDKYAFKKEEKDD